MKNKIAYYFDIFLKLGYLFDENNNEGCLPFLPIDKLPVDVNLLYFLPFPFSFLGIWSRHINPILFLSMEKKKEQSQLPLTVSSIVGTIF